MIEIRPFWSTKIVLETVLIYDALRNLVPFVQYKKREKHPCRGDTFNINGTKSRKRLMLLHNIDLHPWKKTEVR